MECDVRKSKNHDAKSERFKLVLDSSNVNSLILLEPHLAYFSFFFFLLYHFTQVQITLQNTLNSSLNTLNI